MVLSKESQTLEKVSILGYFMHFPRIAFDASLIQAKKPVAAVGKSTSKLVKLESVAEKYRYYGFI